MSVNRRTLVLHRTKDSQGENRELCVYEEDNSQDIVNTTTWFANTYSKFTFEYEYKTSTFLFADVYVTNRFTMDTYKKVPPISFNMGETSFIPIPNTNSYFQASVDTAKKRTKLEVVLSMADFMFGDIYVQFYDSLTPQEEKEKYCEPIIVQFTNAPTVYAANIYKWNPNSATKLPDEDTVFTSSFGSVSAGIPDVGRADVLSGSPVAATNYYNDFLSADRLITNGLAETETASFSGHPVYTIEYTAFVPSSFSEQFGYTTNSVAFSAINNEQGYLTSAVDNWQTMQTEKFDLHMYLQDTDRKYQLSAVRGYQGEITAVGGVKQTFVAHLTAAPGDKPDDKWFRQHTRACADFVLSGLDPYWTGESEELPPRLRLAYNTREYVSVDEKYIPPSFELAWYATGMPTYYYVLRKGGNRNVDSDWICVFDPNDYKKYVPQYHEVRIVTYVYRKDDPALEQMYINHENSIELVPETYHIRDNLPEIELDANNRPIIKMYFAYQYTWYSDSVDAAQHFKILDEEEKNNLKAIVYRTSDNLPADFSLVHGDAEFMLLYNV